MCNKQRMMMTPFTLNASTYWSQMSINLAIDFIAIFDTTFVSVHLFGIIIAVRLIINFEEY